MVATSAFGMGVDKPNVRYVVHEQVPGSLEQYVQEAGRAGRDGRRALCVLLFDPSDLKIQARLHAEGRPRPEAIGRLCDALRVWAANGKPVEPKTLALSAQVTGAAAKAVLVMLNELGAVAVEGSRYRLVVSSEELDSIAHDLARRFEPLRREDRHRLEAVEAYARTNECRSVFLRRYFGEQEPPTCGMCDRCVARAEAARVVHVLPG
jgi:ATP-dependent DNA helicase RecQ